MSKSKINYVVTGEGPRALKDLVVVHEKNSSRTILHVRTLTNGFDSKTGYPSRMFNDLVRSMDENGFDSARAGNLVSTPPDKTERGTYSAQLVRLRKELSELELSKKGFYAYDESDGSVTRVTNLHIQNAFDMIWGSPSKKGAIQTTAKAESVQSGNTRIVAIIFVIALRLTRGEKIDSNDPIFSAPTQSRSYDTDLDRMKDCVFLNESGKQGKTETTIKEKCIAAFGMATLGFRHRDLRPIFVKNGIVQQLGEFIKVRNYLEWAGCTEESNAWEGFLTDPAKTLPSQPHLLSIRPLRIAMEHSDGDGDNKKSWLRDEADKKNADPVLVQDHLEANPKAAKPLVDYIGGIMAGKSAAPRVRGISRKDLRTLATETKKVSREVSSLLVALSDDDKVATKRAIDSVLKARVFLRDKNGELTGKVLTQKSFDLMLRNGIKKQKVASGRQKRSG